MVHIKNKFLFGIVFIFMISLVSALNQTYVQDNFDRANGALGTATNGEDWWSIAGSTNPVITSSQGRWEDTGTDPVAILNFTTTLLKDAYFCTDTKTSALGTSGNSGDIILRQGTTVTQRVEFTGGAPNSIRVFNKATTTSVGTWTTTTWYEVCFKLMNTTHFRMYLDGTDKGTYKNVNNVTVYADNVKLDSGGAGTGQVTLYENVSILKEANYTITAVNAINGTSVNSFSVYIQNGTTTNTYYTSSGSVDKIQLTSKRKYNITFFNTSLYVNRTYTDYNFSTSGNLEGQLYKKNSIIIQTYWVNGTYLHDTFDVNILSDSYSNSTTTNASGFLELHNLVPDYYLITVNKNTFYPINYYVNVTNGSFTQLNVYFVNTTLANEKTFYAKDSILLTPLPDTLLTFTRLINSSWVTIGQIEADGLGFGAIYLENGKTYRLLVEESNHTTKLMNLNTISSISSYDILLDPVSSLDFEEFYDLFNYYILPSGTTKLNRGNISFNITTSSVGSYLDWFAVYYNSTEFDNVTGSPAGGTAVIYLNTSNLSEYFKIQYLIKLDNHDIINRTVNYQVQQMTVNGSFVDIEEDDPFTTDKNRGIFASLIIVLSLLLVSRLFDIDRPDGSKSLNALALIVPIIFFIFIGFINGIIGGMVCTLLVFTLIPKGD